jgi:hypothetical protein
MKVKEGSNNRGRSSFAWDMEWFVPALAILACLVSTPATANAAFPGTNGKIAFTSDPTGSDLDVYTMNPNGSGQTNLTSNPASDSIPTWSPDGEQILFSTDRDINDEIYFMNANGTSPTDLTNNSLSDTAPAWSPDGQKIAFTRDDGSFNLDIWSMNANGSAQTNLTNNAALDTGAAWSPGGQKIAFTTTRDGNSEIYVMNADGTGQTRLTNNSTTDSGADWSPGGQKIAFTGRRDGNPEIYTMNADGSNPTRLTNNSASDFSPAFSPDGQEIAFRSNRDGNYEIYIMNADGTGQTRLTNNTWLDTDPDWQPIPPAYPRPTGATPIRVPLVPAMVQCTSPNSTHGGTLPVTSSCSNPQIVSSTATLGSSTDAFARLGFVKITVCNTTSAPGCSGLSTEPDVRLFGNGSDVVCKPGAPVAACPGGAGSDYDPNTAAGPYTAGLDLGTNSNTTPPTPICNPSPPNPSACAVGSDMTARAEIPGSTGSAGKAIRVTDSFNGTASGTDPPACGATTSCSGTVRDQGFPVPVVCKATSSTAIGSYCGANTTANALVPGVVVAGKAAIVELGQIQVFDSGPDGIRNNGDDQLFAVQGVFVS